MNSIPPLDVSAPSTQRAALRDLTVLNRSYRYRSFRYMDPGWPPHTISLVVDNRILFLLLAPYQQVEAPTP